MPAVQVRDLEQDVYEQLKASAARNKRSISQQVEYYICEGLRNDERRIRAQEEGEEYDPVWGVRLRKEELPSIPPHLIQRDLTPEERARKWEILEARIKALPKIDTTGLPSPAEMIREDRDELSGRMARIEREVYA